MRAEYKPWTSQRILWMATQLFRYAVWFVVGELFVHFSYHASLRYAFTFVIGQVSHCPNPDMLKSEMNDSSESV